MNFSVSVVWCQARGRVWAASTDPVYDRILLRGLCLGAARVQGDVVNVGARKGRVAARQLGRIAGDMTTIKNLSPLP